MVLCIQDHFIIFRRFITSWNIYVEFNIEFFYLCCKIILDI